MNRPVKEFSLFVLLVSLGVVVRLSLRHIPNFAPVAGIALFAGFFFARRSVAVCVPLAVMAISDVLIGGYEWTLMITVYSLLALPVCLGGPLRGYVAGAKGWSSVAGATLGLGGCTLACSLIFFLGTNGMVWLSGGWYEPTLAGLLRCYTAALPFFRYTLAGDACFAAALFGAYALTTSAGKVRVPAVAGAEQ